MPDTKVAIVTGAGSGVGRETAIQLAAAGYSVVLVARTTGTLEETAASARTRAAGAEVHPFPTDLRDGEATAAMVLGVIDRFVHVDAIAHVAGYAPLMPIEDVTPSICRDTLDTNLAAAVNLAAAAWPSMAGRQSGVIVNVSSLASVDPFPGFSVYAAAKIGVNLFTRCLAQEGESCGIRAVSIAPGAIETPMFRAIFSEEQFPKSKTLDPADVARVIVACITGERGFDPGEVIQLPNPE